MATNKDFVVKNGLQVGANTSIEGSITTVDSVQFDTNANITVGVGQLAWNADAGTLDLGISSDVTLQVGQETHVHVKAAEAITNGDVVYASGAVGNSGQIEVSKFIADGSIEERRVIGIATESAALGEFFYVTSFGAIRGISTDGSALTTPENWNLGDILYASPTVAGELTKTLPVAPNPAIAIAFITSEHASNGTLFVRAYDPGFHLGELHDVHISSVANNQVLTYDAVNSRWNNSDDLNLPGDLTVAGNFTVSGNTTLVNTNNLAIEDLNIVLANGAANAAAADGAGITIDGANATLTYVNSGDKWSFNKALNVDGNTNIAGNLDLSASSTETRTLQIGHNRSGDGISLIDLVGDTTYSDWGFRIQREGTANGKSSLLHHGTGNLEIRALEEATIRFKTDDADRMQIKGGGDITMFDTLGAQYTVWDASEASISATTLNGAFGNTAVTIASSYPVTPSTGNMWFDNLNLKLKIFDGNNWQDAVPSGGGSSANTQTTDANATFAKYTYILTSSSSTVSGLDVANNTLSYDTSGIENIEVFVNGVKQVEGASYDYTATTGTSVGFTTTLSAGDVVDVQVYELLTNDAFVLKAGGAFEGTVEFTNTSISQTFTNASLAHGMTLIADTDEFLRINREAAGGSGGVRLSALTDGSTAFNVSAYSTTPSTDGNNAVIRLRASKSDGSTSETALASNDDLLTIGNTGSEIVTVKGSGRTIFTPIDNTEAITVSHNGAAQGNDAMIAFVNGYTQNFKIGMSDTWGNRDFWIVETSAGAGTDTKNPAYRFKGDGDGLFSITDEAGDDVKVVLDTNGDSYLIGGNVGIGTDTPATRLHVATNSNVNVGMRVETGLDDNNQSDPIGIQLWQPTGDTTSSISLSYSLGGAERAKIDGTRGGTATGGHLRFYTQSSGTTTHFITLNESGHFLPATSAQDLGTSTNPWQNIYTQDLVLSNEARATGNDIDGTKGNWTVQEGEDHLYLINNKNGKKYRFALEEIE